ncbi:MAG: hypothetical protein Q9170_000559 [Blastenia crenularia]
MPKLLLTLTRSIKPLQNLAHFVRSHEKALASALQSRQQRDKAGGNVSQTARASSAPLAAAPSANSTSSISGVLVSALSLSSLNFASHGVKPAKLTLTAHHLFYLLSRFEEVGIAVGPLNVRTEHLHAEVSPANYVSFLSQSRRSHRRTDRDSIHSVTSVRSVVSGISTFWSGLGASNSAAKTEKAQAQLLLDLKYLYSAFTKIPCLRLAPDHKARLIRGYEEFPFDTAVPLHAFKNLSTLEICDEDFRSFLGWDRLAEQIQSLTLKRANIDNPSEVLTGIVLDDMDRRRWRSSKPQSSPVLAWPSSPPLRFAHEAKLKSTPSSPVLDDSLDKSSALRSGCLLATQNANYSLNRPASARQTSFRPLRSNSTKIKRSGSGSSESSTQSSPPPLGAYRIGSSSNLSLAEALPSSKWRFLRHLSLADNALTSIPGGSLTPLADNLCSLDLSSNLFMEVPDGLASLVVLRALNLSNCMIGSLQSLIKHPLPAIIALNLRANRLDSVIGVERLLSLERLDLRDNSLRDPAELARLTGLPDFREVWVAMNPFTKSHKNYRAAIFNLFRNTPGSIDDIVIDALGPTYSERKLLIDHVAEGEPIPVVRNTCSRTPTHRSALTSIQRDIFLQYLPHTEADGTDASHQDSNLDDRSSIPTIAHCTTLEASNHVGTKLKRPKKGVRRPRVVDLAHTMDLEDLSSTGPILEGQESKAVSVKSPVESHLLSSVSPSDRPGCRDHNNDAVGLSHVRARSPSPFKTHEALSSDDLQSTKLKAQIYRQRIEALRQEVGSNWLNALAEEGWTSDRSEGSGVAALPPMRPQVSLIHTTSGNFT